MEMPVFRPVIIRTRGRSFWARFNNWLMATRKWEVAKDWVYVLPNGVRIIIPEYFIFDGASIPKLFWPLLSPTGILLIPGLLHDFAYRYDYLWALDLDGMLYRYREGAGRKEWDELLYEVGSAVNGMDTLDWIAWAVLRPAGFRAWNRNRRRNAREIHPQGYREAA